VDLSGSLITGLADGRIVKIYEEEVGKRLRYTVLARTGIDDPKCGSSIEFEEECGRPLGLELINNAKTLIVLDTKVTPRAKYLENSYKEYAQSQSMKHAIVLWH